MTDYQTLIDSFVDTIPKLNKVGWIGDTLTSQRRAFIAEYGNTSFSEGLTNTWDRSDPSNLWVNTKTYKSFQAQIDRWKYLLDMVGVGWSARTKVLFSSPRIVFLVDRPYEEWWFEFLEPWKHFVPVKNDLSDLARNFEIVELDKGLQKQIKNEQRIFAKKYLTRQAAVCRIGRIIEEL